MTSDGAKLRKIHFLKFICVCVCVLGGGGHFSPGLHVSQVVQLSLNFLCSKDYLRITDGMRKTFGVYCGNRTGENVFVTGDQVRIIFHSDDDIQRRGYLLVLTLVREGEWEHKEADKRA